MIDDFTELLQSMVASLRLSDRHTCNHICNHVATALDKPVTSARLVKDAPASNPRISLETVDLEGNDAHADLVHNIQKTNPKLAWREPGFGRIPDTIASHLAVCEIIGPHGQIAHKDIRVGLLHQAANVTYPSHNHAAEEVYLVLTGPQEWQKDNDAWYEGSSGDFIHHLPYQPHAIRTARTPLLALWVWTGNIDGSTYRI